MAAARLLLAVLVCCAVAPAQSLTNQTETTKLQKTQRNRPIIQINAAIKVTTDQPAKLTFQKQKIQKLKQNADSSDSNLKAVSKEFDAASNSAPAGEVENLQNDAVPFGHQFILANGRRFHVRQTPFQQALPPHLDTAIGAISAHLLTQPGQEYIPFPPNGNPAYYSAYRGNTFATEPSLIATYDKANSAGYGPYPTAKNMRQVFTGQPPYFGFGNPGSFFQGFYNPEPFPFYSNPNLSFANRKDDVEEVTESAVKAQTKQPIKRRTW